MNQDKILQNVALGAGSLHFNVGSPMSMATALIVNQHLPLVMTDDNHEFLTRWSVEVLPIAKQEIAKIAKYQMVDETLALEMARLVYQHRLRIAKDPLYILFEMLTAYNYVEAEYKENRMYKDEHVFHQAFYYIMEVVFTNRREILTYFSDINYMRSPTRLIDQLTDRIYDALDAALKEVPPETMQAYHRVVRSVVTDMFEMYRGNMKFEYITDSKFMMLVENQVVSAMQGSITRQPLVAFINAFYGKEVKSREEAMREDQNLTSFAQDWSEEGHDVEGFGEGFDAESYGNQLEERFAVVERNEQLLRELLAEGISRTDAIMLGNLHPVKDRELLAQFPEKRDGTVADAEVVMGLFGAIRKAGQGLIKAAIRFIEAIITNVINFFGAPFNLKVRFSVTERGELIDKWKKAFNKPIHGLIATGLPIVAEQRVGPEAIKSSLNHIGDYVDLFERLADEAEESFRSDNKEELERINDEMNRRGLEIASGFDAAINTSGVFSNIVKEPVTGTGLSAANGEPLVKATELSSFINVTEMQNKIRNAKTDGYGSIDITEAAIEKVVSVFPAIDVMEKTAEELEQTARDIQRKVKRIHRIDFKFMERQSEKADVLEQEQVVRESFVVHNHTLKTMARTASALASTYRSIAQEAVSMKVTWMAATEK
ncbi:hypothetical protein CZP2022_172 [Vibrio phage C-ZP2022]|nr:hypothetical protein CZP2022_172 [Vibrio phage C-ZP2022]